MGERGRGAFPRVLLAGYLILCAAALIWPGYAWLGNRVEPYVLGLPFVLAWNLGWVVLTFLALAFYHVTSGDRS